MRARGASFEIASLEVIACDEVAYAYALLRCGTAEELSEKPENRLRLSAEPALRAAHPVGARTPPFNH
jgi:hypothetical protein